MAHCIFFVGRSLGKSLVPPVGHKYGVISETTTACGSFNYMAVYYTIDSVCLAVFDQGYHCAETGFAIFLAGEILKQQCSIGSRVMTLAGSITCRVYARRAVQSLYFKTSVIGKAIVSITFLHPPGFQQSVALKCIGCLRNIVMAAYIGQRKDGESVTHHLSQLFKFMRIVTCKYYFFHQCFNGKYSDLLYCLSNYYVNDLAGYHDNLSYGLSVEPFCR